MHNLSHPNDQVPVGLVGRWWRRLLGYPQPSCCEAKADEPSPVSQARGPHALPGKWPTAPSHIVRKIAADFQQPVNAHNKASR